VDQIALVEEQIRAGQKLVERLNREDVPVLAAAWVNESESGRWYLYLVTPLVGDEGGTRPAYKRVLAVVRRLQAEGLWIDPLEVKVVSPTNPVGEAIAEAQPQQAGRGASRYGGASLGGLSVEGAYVYPQTR
jgi:hypothetical protein